MGKYPYFQFYPGDWLKDGALRRCSPAARGLWIDMLCLMHNSETECSLESGGTPWTDDEIVGAVSGFAKVLLPALQELFDKGVAKRSESGAVYSKRLRDDAAVRAVRASAGSKGGSKRQANRVANRVAKRYQNPVSDSVSDNEDETGKKKSTQRPLDLPLPFEGLAFSVLWAEFDEHRRRMNKPWTVLAAKKILTKLGAMSHDDAIAAINNSIESGWAGVFPPKGNGQPRSPARIKSEPGKYDNVGIKIPPYDPARSG